MVSACLSFNWFENELIWNSTGLKMFESPNCFEIQLIELDLISISIALNLNWCHIQVVELGFIVKPNDIKFSGVEVRLMRGSNDFYSGFIWFELQLIWNLIDLRFNKLNFELLSDSSFELLSDFQIHFSLHRLFRFIYIIDFEIQSSWKQVDLRFNWFEIHLIWK